MRSLIILVFLIGTLIPLTAQVLPDELHCLPVLIEIPLQDKIHSSFGTGVFINESNKVFLITAAHVIFNVNSTNNLELINSEAILSVFKLGKNTTNKNILVVNLKKSLDGGLLKRHPTHDIAVIQTGGFANVSATNRNVFEGFFCEQFVTCLNGSAMDSFTMENFKNFKDIEDGSETYVFGYPVELLNNHIQSEVDFSYPLIRKGIISQRNQKTGKLILDSGVYGGNSGGPVVIVEHPTYGSTTYKVGGLITQFVPVMTRLVPQIGVTNSDFVNSGYSVAEPIDYALELMRQ